MVDAVALFLVYIFIHPEQPDLVCFKLPVNLANPHILYLHCFLTELRAQSTP